LNFRGNSLNLRGNSLNLRGDSLNLCGNSLNLFGNSLNLRGNSLNLRGDSRPITKWWVDGADARLWKSGPSLAEADPKDHKNSLNSGIRGISVSQTLAPEFLELKSRNQCCHGA
jgi:hypothetical protein